MPRIKCHNLNCYSERQTWKPQGKLRLHLQDTTNKKFNENNVQNETKQKLKRKCQTIQNPDILLTTTKEKLSVTKKKKF